MRARRRSLVSTPLFSVVLVIISISSQAMAGEHLSAPLRGSSKPLPSGVKVQPHPGFQVGKSDLVPIANPDPGAGQTDSGLCARDSRGNLVLYVKNQGAVATPASMTAATVRFPKAGKTELPRIPGGIPPGAIVTLPAIEIPAAACGPDCVFTVFVDSPPQIDEANELNNFAVGVCVVD